MLLMVRTFIFSCLNVQSNLQFINCLKWHLNFWLPWHRIVINLLQIPSLFFLKLRCLLSLLGVSGSITMTSIICWTFLIRGPLPSSRASLYFESKVEYLISLQRSTLLPPFYFFQKNVLRFPKGRPQWMQLDSSISSSAKKEIDSLVSARDDFLLHFSSTSLHFLVFLHSQSCLLYLTSDIGKNGIMRSKTNYAKHSKITYIFKNYNSKLSKLCRFLFKMLHK